MEIITEPEIRVGLYTDGEADAKVLTDADGQGDVTLLRNLLIGKGYHWERRIEAKLPGRVLLPGDTGFDRGCLNEGVGAVNVLPAETYLGCVAVSEMNPSAPVEFLKAHAIIARSWLFHKLMHGDSSLSAEGRVDSPHMLVDWDDTTSHSFFDVCSDDHCQRYQGLRELPENVAEALKATRGVVLTDADRRVADARYSKCCGGHTEDFSACWGGDAPSYLAGHADEHCDLSEMPEPLRLHFFETALKDYDRNPEPFGAWETVISKEEVAENLRRKFGRDLGAVRTVRVLERGRSGRAFMAMAEGEKGNLILGKELMIRRLLSPTHLYSSLIEIRDEGATLRISGRGWGHGVGLCQIGAAHMALKGASAEEILAYYYPGTHLRPLY